MHTSALFMGKMLLTPVFSLLLITAGKAQPSHKFNIHKKQIGFYNDRKLFSWMRYDSISNSFSCWVIFKYADQLRTPSKYDSISIIMMDGKKVTLENKLVNTIEPIESFSGPWIVKPPTRGVLFEITYSCTLPDTLVRQLRRNPIQAIQLQSAPAFQPENWLRKFDIIVKKNYDMALRGRHETIIYGNKKISAKQAGEWMSFFKHFPLKSNLNH